MGSFFGAVNQIWEPFKTGSFFLLEMLLKLGSLSVALYATLLLPYLFWIYLSFKPHQQSCLDLIERKQRAKLIAQEILDTSEVGLHRFAMTGRWGSGKTYLTSMVSEELHKKLDVISVRMALAKKPEDIIGRLADEIAYRSSCLILKPWVAIQNFLGRLTELSLGIGGINLKVIRSTFPHTQERLSEATQRLKKPLLVIIDDLDRIDPDSIAKFLATFEEISYLPRVTFLCVFDSEVVLTAIAEHHPAWKQSDEFMEKMFDEEFEIGLLTNEESQSLFLKMAGTFFPEEGKKSLLEVGKLLPPTPRMIKRLVEKTSKLNESLNKIKALDTNLFGLITFDSMFGPISGVSIYKSYILYRSLKLINRPLADSIVQDNSHGIIDEKKREQYISEVLEEHSKNKTYDEICRLILEDILTGFSFPYVNVLEEIVLTNDMKPFSLLGDYIAGYYTKDELYKKIDEYTPINPKETNAFVISDALISLYKMMLWKCSRAFLVEEKDIYAQKATKLLEVLKDYLPQAITAEDGIQLFEAFIKASHQYININDRDLKAQEDQIIVETIQKSKIYELLNIFRYSESSFPRRDAELEARKERILRHFSEIAPPYNYAECLRVLMHEELFDHRKNHDQIWEKLRDPQSEIWGATSQIWEAPLSETIASNLGQILYEMKSNLTIRDNFISDPTFAIKLWKFMIQKPWHHSGSIYLENFYHYFDEKHPDQIHKLKKPSWFPTFETENV